METLAEHIDRCQYGSVVSVPDVALLDVAVPAHLAQVVQRCCAGDSGGLISREDAEVIARLLKAVADPVRLQILGIVRSSPRQEVCACDLPAALGLAQPTVSHHLKTLVDAGVLTRERRGQWAWFTLVPEHLALARRVLQA